MNAEWGRRIGLRVVAVVVLGVLWQVTAVVMDNPTFIPSPAAVWHRLIQTSTTHDGSRGYSGHLLIEHLGVSLRRILRRPGAARPHPATARCGSAAGSAS